jgi:hypothetical protein
MHTETFVTLVDFSVASEEAVDCKPNCLDTYLAFWCCVVDGVGVKNADTISLEKSRGNKRTMHAVVLMISGRDFVLKFGEVGGRR